MLYCWKFNSCNIISLCTCTFLSVEQHTVQRVKTPEALVEKTEVDIEYPCIWDASEISVLRQAYKTLKQQSIEAMVHVRETVKRNEELETLTAKQRKAIDSQKVKLTEARIANKRLQINVESLSEEVKYLTAKVGAMEDVISEIKEEKTDMMQELQDNRITTDKERMERNRIQIKLDSLRKEALAEKMAAEDKIRTQCKKAIHDLKEEVKRLQAELYEETSKRKVTEKGLKHLRNHFSGLAVHEILPRTAVTNDQVSNIQY